MANGERWYQGINRGQWLAMVAAVLGWMFDGFEMGLHPLVAGPALQELLREEAELDVRARLDELGGLGDVPDSATRLRIEEALNTPGRPMFGRFKTVVKGESKLPEEVRTNLLRALEKRINDWNAYTTAVFLFGAAAGGVVFGWLGDRIGRTKAMMWSVLAYSLFTGLGGFAQSPLHLAFCRFLASLGMGGEWALGVALVMETWPAKARPMLAGFIGAASNVGFLLIGVVSLSLGTLLKGEVSWRWLMFIGVLPAALTFLIRLFVPESEKWKQATANARKPRVREVFSGGLGRLTVLAILICGVPLLATWGAVQQIPMWTVRMNEERPGGPVELAKEKVQIGAALGACVGTVIAAVLAGRFGRRVTYVLLCLLSLASTGAIFWRAQDIGPPFYLQVFIAGVTTASFYGWIPLYLPELFPTRIRATGQGLAYNFGRIFAGVGTILFHGPLAELQSGSNLASTLGIVSLIYFLGLALIFLAPETHGKPLPE
jgi:MFS family permease